MRVFNKRRTSVFTLAILVAALSAALCSLQSSGEEQGLVMRSAAGYRASNHRERSDAGTASTTARPASLRPLPGEHPLEPCLRWAKSALADIRRIKDYSCTVVKRERVGSTLSDPQSMTVKVRHEPFSVYLRFANPAKVRGREAIYVEGENQNKLLVHLTGMRHRFLGTVALRPTGKLAMGESRYPVTELGILRLVERLIEVGQSDLKDERCEVRVSRATLDGLACICIEVEHPQSKPGLLFHVAKIFVDERRNLPVRYEAYDWPTEDGQAPELMEQYIYSDLKLNPGFSDLDFDVDNPDYGFARNANARTAMSP